VRVFSGNSNRPLAEAICRHLKLEVAHIEVEPFPDGEIFVKIDENIRGTDVFLIQSTHAPADNLLELLLMIDAARRASARRVTAVIPYFGYARQDRKDQPRVAISAKLVANLITTAGADRLLTMDLHSSQIQGFFDIPLDHLFAAPVLIDYFRAKAIPKLTVVAPDIGSVKMARAYAKRLGAQLALVDKQRTSPERAAALQVIGDVAGRNILIIDDMVTTAGTLTEAAEALMSKGAEEIHAAATHAVLAGPALERIYSSPIRELVVTDTVHQEPSRLGARIKVLSVGDLLAKAVLCIHTEQSLHSLFV
jgi:ribose-phosphate pyrophosphokinase